MQRGPTRTDARPSERSAYVHQGRHLAPRKSRHLSLLFTFGPQTWWGSASQLDIETASRHNPRLIEF